MLLANGIRFPRNGRVYGTIGGEAPLRALFLEDKANEDRKVVSKYVVAIVSNSIKAVYTSFD